MSGTNYGSSNFVIPYQAPDNIPPQLKPYLQPIYTAFQNLIQTLITSGGIAARNPSAVLSSVNDPTAFLANNVHRFYAVALEAINYGAAINLFAPAGTLLVRNASATDGTKQADGFCSQVGGLAPGGAGEFILGDGLILTNNVWAPGSRYFLGTTPGTYSTTPATAAGNLEQELGIALTTTSFRFLRGQKVQH